MNNNHPLQCEPGDVIHVGSNAVIVTIRVGEICGNRVTLCVESPTDEYVDHIGEKGRENWEKACQAIAAQQRVKK